MSTTMYITTRNHLFTTHLFTTNPSIHYHSLPFPTTICFFGTDVRSLGQGQKVGAAGPTFAGDLCSDARWSPWSRPIAVEIGWFSWSSYHWYSMVHDPSFMVFHCQRNPKILHRKNSGHFVPNGFSLVEALRWEPKHEHQPCIAGSSNFQLLGATA